MSIIWDRCCGVSLRHRLRAKFRILTFGHLFIQDVILPVQLRNVVLDGLH